ncbi:maleylacetate reductase [Gordonia sp. 852002-10350_SCH5691597]|uniref:maleylacetate reductase n=1 Tax=Gordonia sp. 852002-10350_SCH5691597 TaxID=1834085 RepID=UPI0007E95696|nr:maleylacetate reductase [Gordonia sp. 852002-10350_SCH5691597]OBA58250.1 maleylacetate reductase [Gordonia sp. 852002-10350_SCH5691597]
MEFTHTTLGQRVRFATGCAAEHLRSELSEQGISRPMVIVSDRDRPLADAGTADTKPSVWWSDIAQHVPVELVERATTAARDSGADGVVCIGGGSITGLAKAVALHTGLAIISVPTTYAGSEATNVWGMTENGVKTTGVDDRVLPAAVIYDAELVRGLPTELAMASGLNALAHCVDSLWAPRADPINRALSLEAASALSSALRGIAANSGDTESLEESLYGSYLAGVAFASAGSGLHHKICHVLGGAFDLPHAQTHAVVLPHVLAFNAPAVPELAARLATALGASASEQGEVTAVAALNELYSVVGAPNRLSDIGFPDDGAELVVDRILEVAPPSNPMPVTRGALLSLLAAARVGAPAIGDEVGTRGEGGAR